MSADHVSTEFKVGDHIEILVPVFGGGRWVRGVITGCHVSISGRVGFSVRTVNSGHGGVSRCRLRPLISKLIASKLTDT